MSKCSYCNDAQRCVSRGVVPATRMGLQPQGLMCLGVSNWGDWDLGDSYHAN